MLMQHPAEFSELQLLKDKQMITFTLNSVNDLGNGFPDRLHITSSNTLNLFLNINYYPGENTVDVLIEELYASWHSRHQLPQS